MFSGEIKSCNWICLCAIIRVEDQIALRKFKHLNKVAYSMTESTISKCLCLGAREEQCELLIYLINEEMMIVFVKQPMALPRSASKTISEGTNSIGNQKKKINNKYKTIL